MSYTFKTNEQRSRIMRSIKSTETTAEICLRKCLWHRGFRYRKNLKSLPGRPDIVLTKYRVAIFVDGEFWHGFRWDKKKQAMKDNRDYWIPKIEKTISRDKNNNEELHRLGWTVLRFWSNDVIKNVDYCVETVVAEIENKVIKNYAR